MRSIAINFTIVVGRRAVNDVQESWEEREEEKKEKKIMCQGWKDEKKKKEWVNDSRWIKMHSEVNTKIINNDAWRWLMWMDVCLVGKKVIDTCYLSCGGTLRNKVVSDQGRRKWKDEQEEKIIHMDTMWLQWKEKSATIFNARLFGGTSEWPSQVMCISEWSHWFIRLHFVLSTELGVRERVSIHCL